MTKAEPQPPERTLRRWTGTRLLGGTTSDHPTDSAVPPARRNQQPEPAAPLLPAGARRPAAITAACCAVLVAVLGVLSIHRSHGNVVDRPIDSWIHQHLGSHTQLLVDIAYLGGNQGVAELTAILVLACLAARRLNGAVLAVIAVGATIGLTEYVLKPLVHERIGTSLTYPSGHMASLCSVFAVVGVLMLDPPRHRPRPLVRLLLMLGLVAVSGIVAVAVIGLNFHYFTDTIAGAALAVGVALATSFPLDRPGVRRLLGAARLPWGRGS